MKSKIPVTVFHRPNARKELANVTVNDETADLAARILEAIDDAAFTYEDIGGPISLCLEGSVIDSDGLADMDDIVIDIVPYASVDRCDWAGFVLACMSNKTVSAALQKKAKGDS